MGTRSIAVSMGLVLCLCFSATWAAEQTSEAAFADGSAKLADGDFAGALDAYKTAVKLAPDNETYRQEAALLQRVMKIRQRFDSITNTEQWNNLATGLHAYYHDNDIYPEALKLDLEIHKKWNNADSANLLARSYLEMGKYSEAVNLLEERADTKDSAENTLLLGIAKAHLGDVAAAKLQLDSAKIPADAGPVLNLDCARLCALVGDEEGAVAMLTKSLQTTPPSRIEAARAAAKAHGDFASISASKAFATCLATESKVTESKCSGGSSCAKCPSRAKCGSKK